MYEVNKALKTWVFVSWNQLTLYLTIENITTIAVSAYTLLLISLIVSMKQKQSEHKRTHLLHVNNEFHGLLFRNSY